MRLRMTDETPRVNACHRVAPSLPSGRAWTDWRGPAGLMQILSGPGEECIELVRIEQEINDEPGRSQHEYGIAHERFPSGILRFKQRVEDTRERACGEHCRGQPADRVNNVRIKNAE